MENAYRQGAPNGGNAAAQALIDSLPAAGRARLLAVDFHPETLKRLKALGIAGRFGDLALTFQGIRNPIRI